MLTGEWLETDGLGGYAMGNADGIPTRRYHSLLTSAVIPPTSRAVLVNAHEVWFEEDGGRTPLAAVRYAPRTVVPDHRAFLTAFTASPWPTWHFTTPQGTHLTCELFIPRGATLSVLTWRIQKGTHGTLTVRPFISVRDHHALHFKNSAALLSTTIMRERLFWQPYQDASRVLALSTGTFTPEPHWYEHIELTEERARGYPSQEDLISPGVFSFALTTQTPARLILADAARAESHLFPRETCVDAAHRFEQSERARRASFASPLHLASEDFIVQRGRGLTILAGYPWFTDWGRDTFIAMRGLTIATGKFEESLAILS